MSYRYVRLQDGRTEMAWVNDPIPFNWSSVTLGGIITAILIINFLVLAATIARHFGATAGYDILKVGGLFYVAVVGGRHIRRFTARFRRH